MIACLRKGPNGKTKAGGAYELLQLKLSLLDHSTIQLFQENMNIFRWFIARNVAKLVYH
jgi:hypothetical protein